MGQEFYWKGSDTLEANSSDYGDGFSESTYWNNASNWFVKGTTTPSSLDSLSFTGESEYFLPADRFPQGGDKVYFKKLSRDASIGLNDGPWPKSPCLFGGMTLNGPTLEWINSSGTTAQKTTYCDSIIIDDTYGCDWVDPVSGIRLDGWNLGFNGASYENGVSWDGLYLGANNIYDNQNGRAVVIKYFNGGNYYRFGSSFISIEGGSADNFIYSQDNSVLEENECSPNSGGLSQIWVKCDISNTIRIDSAYISPGYFNHISNTKVKHLIVSPYKADIGFWRFYCDAENIEIHPWTRNTQSQFYTYFDISGKIDGSSGEYDNINISDSNKYYDNISFDGNNCNLRLQSSAGISALNMFSGNFKIGNLFSSDIVNIQSGVIGFNSNLYLYGNDEDTQITFGPVRSGNDDDGILIVTDGIDIPKLYFSPGAYLRCYSGTSGDYSSALNSGTKFESDISGYFPSKP